MIMVKPVMDRAVEQCIPTISKKERHRNAGMNGDSNQKEEQESQKEEPNQRV
jgi:hypothetical protein